MEATVRMSLCVGMNDTCEDDMGGFVDFALYQLSRGRRYTLNGGGQAVMCCVLRHGLAV